MDRFPSIAVTHEDALRYYRNRAIQLLCTDWTREGAPEILPWGVHVRMRRGGRVYHSLYVLRGSCGQGHLSRWRRENPGAVFVVMDACEAVTGWLDAKGVPYEVARPFAAPEYAAIERFYGDRRSARSGQPYMNHIDEGLLALRRLGASDAAMRGFCLHPLVQMDEDLARTWEEGHLAGLPAGPLALALEYRNVANRHLSRHSVARSGDIALSPLRDVNDMLRADKIQNRKDFERHHYPTHPQRERLERYFAEWFERLEISEAVYRAIVAEIDARTGGSAEGNPG